MEEPTQMQYSDEILAIIPAHNEEITIGSVVLQVKEHVDHVIVVNDGSTDKTAAVAAMAGAYVITLEKNKGKATALMAGLKKAKAMGAGCVVLIDADGQHIAEDIPRVISPVIKGESDMVIGSRFFDNGHKIPLYRKAGQKTLNQLTELISKQKLTDTQSGFRALGKNALNNLDFDSDGYGIESEMIIHFAERGLRIEEVPIDVRYDVPNGHKKGPVSMGVKLSNQIFLQNVYRRPLALFGVPGLVLATLGFVLGFMSMHPFHAYLLGWTWLFQALIASYLVIIGSMLAIFAILLHSMIRMNRTRNRKPPTDEVKTIEIPPMNGRYGR